MWGYIRVCGWLFYTCLREVGGLNLELRFLLIFCSSFDSCFLLSFLYLLSWMEMLMSFCLRKKGFFPDSTFAFSSFLCWEMVCCLRKRFVRWFFSETSFWNLSFRESIWSLVRWFTPEFLNLVDFLTLLHVPSSLDLVMAL